MSKIYTHNSATPTFNLERLYSMAVSAIAIVLLLSLFTTAQAYECTIQQDTTCVIEMSEVIADDANVTVALQYCEDVNGVYNYEYDTCVID